ncbi:MAG TPA: hypothetical protein PLO59_02080, partial [Bacteroidia bacterium]|nr:hypothetical protein [Bacteroidia bacterium]
SKLQVLILALSLHTDISTIKDALSSSQNYDVSVNYIDDFKGNVTSYNLIILHQLPDAKHKNLIDQIYKSDVPQWTIIGMQTDITALNGVQAGININASNGKTNSVQASMDKNFGLFTWSVALQESIENWPPLTIPFGVYRPTSECVIALNQRIGNVVSNQPLLLLSNLNKKNAILCGEGLWRWSLKDFAVNNSKTLADEFILKTVQYLATAENKSPFRVKHKNYVYDNEAIIIDAELVNEAGELINSNDVMLEISGNGKTYNYTFSKTNLAYTLQAGLFPVGTYKLKSTASIGTKQYTYHGSLTVAPLQAELTSSIANHNMLLNVAQRSGGVMVYPQSLDAISKLIESRPEITSTSYLHKELKDLVNEKWVFVLLITLLSTEWFVRKYAGAY